MGSQTFTLTPDPGYHIVSLIINGVDYGARTSFTYTPVASSLTVVANFAATVPTNNITATAGTGGSINPT